MSSTSLWNRFQKYYVTKRALGALALGAALLSGCDNPQKTVDSLRRELMEFKAAPDEAKQVKIDASFAKLESQIIAL